jgi:hypothetical protein
MAEPGETVSQRDPRQDQPRILQDQSQHERCQCTGRPQEMHASIGGIRMLAEIERIKLGKCPVFPHLE